MTFPDDHIKPYNFKNIWEKAAPSPTRNGELRRLWVAIRAVGCK